MRAALLEEMDQQRGLAYMGSRARPYRWFYALAAHGVILDDVAQFWTDWWALGTVGHAVAAVQYISCLLYGAHDNPVFTPWTREGGGGPPCLWAFAGHLYSHRWQEPNVQFLCKALTTQAVVDVLSQAVARLEGQPERRLARAVIAKDGGRLCMTQYIEQPDIELGIDVIAQGREIRIDPFDRLPAITDALVLVLGDGLRERVELPMKPLGQV